MAIKLLPCPFCRNAHVQILPQEGWKIVRCVTCGASKREVTESNAVIANAWNLRNGVIDPRYFNDSSEGNEV